MSSIVESALPDPIAGQRIDYWEWIEQHAVPVMRDKLLVLRDHWRDCNDRYFDGRMVLPYVTLTQPSMPSVLGQCCSVSSWGSRLEIKLRPSLLDVIKPHPLVLRSRLDAAGRMQFVKDVLLHEMIHQHVMEHEPSVDEESYHGHGPVFTAHCNRIGALLGLDEVVVRNRKGSKLPKSPQWPHCVAPPDRYGRPLVWWDEPVTRNRDTGVYEQRPYFFEIDFDKAAPSIWVNPDETIEDFDCSSLSGAELDESITPEIAADVALALKSVLPEIHAVIERLDRRAGESR